MSDRIPVMTCTDIGIAALQALLRPYHLAVEQVADGAPIPGSFWGESEAGLVKNRLLARGDTPVHSALHEACHYICMDSERRQSLHTDAGGDFDEENGVCYLQILLSDHIADFSKDRMFSDMDAWGYTFRLGSAGAWFHNDAQDARRWLVSNGLLDSNGRITWKLREG